VAWRLKRALAAQGISSDIVISIKDHLSLDVERCSIDVDRFLQSCLDPRKVTESIPTIERAVEATRLYQGDLLEDWDEEWCLAEREALLRRHVGSLQALAESFEHRGRLDLALEFAQRAVHAQPLDESLQMIVVRLLVKTGRKASAYNHYHKFANTVRAELGVDPDPRPLREMLGSADPGAQPITSARVLSLPTLLRPNRLPLIGRAVEKQALASLVDNALADGGTSVLLVGEAGIGKSRLAGWVMEEWAARGGVSHSGACVEFNDPVTFQPVFDALEGIIDTKELSSFISQTNHSSSPVRSPLGTTQTYNGRDPLPRDTLRLFSWITGKLAEARCRRPLMLVVEDLQWVDSGSLDFLMYLAARARNLRLAIVMTSRQQGGRVPRFKMDRLARQCAAVFKLDRLARSETAQLVEHIVEGRPTSPGFIAWLQRETEGNPLFVIETLRLLAQRGGGLEVPIREGLASPNPRLTIPDGVRSVVDQRLALLKPSAARVAMVASVLGRSLDDEVLATVAGITQNALSRHIAGLLEAGILERDGAGYRFTHDKIREVCYESLSPGARRARHVRAAAVLAQRPEVPPHSLAWHQACAQQWGLAAASWTVAGDQSRNLYAYEQALQEYQQATTCLERDGSLSEDEKADRRPGSAGQAATAARYSASHGSGLQADRICAPICGA
jgi:hypothetical protein